MYEFLDNMHPRNLVEIGERGMLEDKGHHPPLPQRRRAVYQLMGTAQRSGH